MKLFCEMVSVMFRSMSFAAEHRDLIWQLLVRELALQFKNTVLGFMWAFARPLLLLVVYTFIFGVVWPRDDDGMPLGTFAMTMFCGMSLYNMFAASVSASCGSVIGRTSFVKQIVFPLEVLPFVQVLSQFVLGLCWLFLLYSGVAIINGRLPFTCLLLPLVLLPLFLLTCGIAWFVSSICVYLRDIKQLVPVVLQMLFFVTPIFWQLDDIKSRSVVIWRYMYLNPLTGMVEALRDVLMRGCFPDMHMILMLTVFGVLAWCCGFAWFVKTKKGFADVV